MDPNEQISLFRSVGCRGSISINALKCQCVCGVKDDEKSSPQTLVLDVNFELDIASCVSNDDIGLTVSYSDVAHHINSFLSKHQFSLLETLLFQLNRSILFAFDRITKIETCVCKTPLNWKEKVSSFSSALSSRKSFVAIGLGTNLGNLSGNLEAANGFIKNICFTKLIKESSTHKTAPLCVENQPKFLNQSLLIETLLTPCELLHSLQEIEQKMGRIRGTKYGPRIIDIDILLFENYISTNQKLIVPHPRIGERRFLIEELAEFGIVIAPTNGDVMKQNCEIF